MKKLKIVLSLITEDNHYQRLHAAAAQKVAHKLDIELHILYSNHDAITQSEHLLDAIDSPGDTRPDGIICFPAGTTLVQVARHATEAGIAWSVLNRDCEYLQELRWKHPATASFSVGLDHSEMGRIQGRQMALLLPQGGQVLYILGPTYSSIVENRQFWMQSTKPGNITVRTLIGNWTEQSGYKAVRSWLQVSKVIATSISLVAAQCDDMAMGARKALDDLTKGAERDHWASVPYIGCDGCPEGGQQWVRMGQLAATVVNPPTAGVALEMMVHAIRNKVQPPERTVFPSVSLPSIDHLAAGAQATIRLDPIMPGDS